MSDQRGPEYQVMFATRRNDIVALERRYGDAGDISDADFGC